MELLQGARDDREWNDLTSEIAKLPLLTIEASIWAEAARIYFDLRRTGKTIRSSVDCLIAQSCLDHDCTLLHSDRDFDAIATIRPLKHIRLDLDTPAP